MSLVKNDHLRRALFVLVLCIVTFSLYFSTGERCLKPSSAGFWLLFVSGMCFGIGYVSFMLYIKKSKPENQ